MVKGITRRVVVVKEPAGQIFEEAIFIVREDAAGSSFSRRDVLAEARQVTENYFSGGTKKRFFRLSYLLFALAGAGATGLFWFLSIILR